MVIFGHNMIELYVSKVKKEFKIISKRLLKCNGLKKYENVNFIMIKLYSVFK